ncbi:MAG: pyrroloquinoline quinone biosynthesis protein PqqE [Gemmatimonadaceae bacterium]|nr:pyrroloquinoline quinone biosynthesis protein PqqE [Acetobacteraceae bacterium]
MNAIPPVAIEPPLALLAELTHRCPLQCPYCANPVELERAAAELDTATWLRVLDEAAALGVLQVHFSGGEPTARKDLLDLVRHAASVGLYSNLITSGVMLDDASLGALADAGLDHVQLSFQDADAAQADRIGGYRNGHARKLVVSRQILAAGLPLTANFVVHRQNLDRLPEMLALGQEIGASRIEIAHVQYYGWGLVNRDALMPSRAQLEQANAAVAQARIDLRGRITVDYVVPDYYAARPKACMGGWAQRVINITPSGQALPCHAAETLPGFDFPSVRTTSLGAIWREDAGFARFRGTAWMPEPCQSCDQREIDWGGCRCQAFALTGDAGATDPACALSPDHFMMADAVAAANARAAEGPAPDLVYRRIRTASLVT